MRLTVGPHDGPSLTGALVTALGSVLAAASYLIAFPPPWKTQEYPAMAVWSIPLAIGAAVLIRLLRPRLAQRPKLVRAGAALGIGIALGIGYAFAVYFVTGGYVLAFDAPMLYCWSIGISAGLLVGFLWPVRPVAGAA